MGSAISYLEPSISTDELAVESYTGALKECVDAIQEDIKKKNKKIKMDDLNIDSMILKARNSESAEVFSYKWSHSPGTKQGSLKFFYLKIKNKNQVISDPNIKMDVNFVFGAREFNATTGKLPAAGS